MLYFIIQENKKKVVICQEKLRTSGKSEVIESFLVPVPGAKYLFQEQYNFPGTYPGIKLPEFNFL